MERNRTFRIRTGVNDGNPVISFNIDNSVEAYEILSLKITQKNAYRLMHSNTGVVVGRVLANGGFGIPNARVSVFVPYDGTGGIEKSVLYGFASARSIDTEGIRYNLLDSYSVDDCHQTVGTFPDKRYMLDDDNWVDVFDKYYRYTTRTNAAGDYMIYGVPVGMQNLHMDVDLSDIGPLSQKPRDMMAEGYNPDMFENPNKFKGGRSIDSLIQIKSEDAALYVYPFWGDTTESPTNASITRHDFNVNYTFKPTCVFMGCVVSDTGENAMSKKCIGAANQGKMSEMMTGEGRIEMIRKTFDGNTEEFSVKGNQLIDSNGVWCYQIPMNLDYVVTDEFGNTVLSDNPEKGVPTRARVRFRISMSESPNDATARKRARYLVPNNPRLVEGDYPEFVSSKEPDYEFGTKTKDENFRDLMWNNVYTVKSYVPRIQKSNLPNNLKHTGIKMVNHPEGNNPMPFNNLRIKMNFTYMFMCALVKALVYLVYGLNTVITAISYGLFKIAHGFIAITYGLKFLKSFGSFWSCESNETGGEYLVGKKYGSRNCNLWHDEMSDGFDDMPNDNINADYDSQALSEPSYFATLYMLAIINQIDEQRCDENSADEGKLAYIVRQIGANNPCTEWSEKKIGIKGFAAFLLAIVYVIGCGITLRGLCETEDGDDMEISPGTIKPLKEAFDLAKQMFDEMVHLTCNNDVAKFFNCIENELAQDNEVTSFNFYNDWMNGVLYFPLWYRRIKPGRNIFGWKIKGKDEWCSADRMAIKSVFVKRRLKIYDTCALHRDLVQNSSSMGEYIQPLEDSYDTVNVGASKADSETGIELTVFNEYSEKNCYGFECHKRVRSYVPIWSGLMKEKETMLGDLVYYYRPCEYNPKYTSDLVTLFATDIVLLGSLSDCDIHGIPQFFKALEGTTYNMPPALLSETYEYKENDGIPTDADDEDFIENRRTEYTGADWGDLGVDQSNYQSGTVWDANENIYDNGGLFYGITCFNSFTKPKSCINLSRICEFGVSLDESQEIPSTSSLNGGGDGYDTLTPDGFVSYDEVYNPDYRSMFATLNANFLRTRLNYRTGLTEYDLRHLYIDNFDGVMSKLMRAPSVNGDTIQGGKANYIGNYNLEKSSDAYLDFRYGNYPKGSGQHKVYFYDYGKPITEIKVKNKNATLKANNRIPRYENSFYFYFGLVEGSTAIDKFYTLYYSDCKNDEVFQPNYGIQTYPSSVCPGGSLDGCLVMSFNADPEFSVVIRNADDEFTEFFADNITVHQFYFGTKPDGVELPGYKHIDLHYRVDDSVVEFIPNGVYSVTVTSGDGDVITDTVEILPPGIGADIEAFPFKCKNVDLDNMFMVTTSGGEYDWSVMFPAIAEYKTDNTVHVITPDGFNRFIGGYIQVGNINLQNFTITVEPVDYMFFMGYYTAPEVTVLGFNETQPVITSTGSGYLGLDDGVFYFGVPYGEQRYIVTITELCYDSEEQTEPEETERIESEIVMVHEGDFKMYINGIDYDLIQAFDTGWVVTRLHPGQGGQEPYYLGTKLYGWNDVDNIGRFYDTSSNTVTGINSVEVDCGTPVGIILEIGHVLSDDYDGNGAVYYDHGQDCSNPYTWSGEYCITQQSLDAYAAMLTVDNTVVHTAVVDDEEIVQTYANITRLVYKDGDGLFRAEYTYYQQGVPTIVCIEYMDGDGGFTYDYVYGFSDLSGTKLSDIWQVAEDMNAVIRRRVEMSRMVKGAFRCGAESTELVVDYRSVSTPVRYLIAGMKEGSAKTFNPHSSDIGNITLAASDGRVVFDTSLETNEVYFTKPTITYDHVEHKYVPYKIIADYLSDADKFPYYVAIQNNIGMAVPTTSSWTGGINPVGLHLVIDNFSDNNKTNPYLNQMFGVHFYDNAINYQQLKVVASFNGMVKYGENTPVTVTTDGLVIGFAVNGMYPEVYLDGSDISIHMSSKDVGNEFLTSDNRRLLYGDSNMYGEYVYDNSYLDEDDNPIDYQYFTLSKNRVLSIQDNYGPGHETTVVCDYRFETNGIVFSTPDQSVINIPIQHNRTLPAGTVHHIFRYNGSNHPLDYVVRDSDDDPWRFQNTSHEDKLNEMFLPGHDFTSDPGFIDTVNTNSYQFMLEKQDIPNRMFVVSEYQPDGIVVFSPLIECMHVNSILRFNYNIQAGQDEYTVYLMRRPTNPQDDDRNGCDISDFYYLTHFPFTLSFKFNDSDTGEWITVLSYEIDPTSQSSICEFLEDGITVSIDNDNDPATPTIDTSGDALKISLTTKSSDFGGNGIPDWYGVWVTDYTGVERRCIGIGGEDTSVSEN